MNLRLGPFRTLAAVFVLVTGTLGQEDAKIDSRATDVVRRLCDHVAKMPAGKLSLESRMVMEAADDKRERTLVIEIAFARPERFRFDLESGGESTTCISNGEKLVLRGGDRYIEEEAPETLGELSTSETGTFLRKVSGGGLLVLSLLAEHPYDDVMEGVLEARHLGTEEIGGAICDHLAFTQEEIDWEIWVSRDEPPVLVREATDLSRAFTKSTGRQVMFRIEHTYRGWKADVELPGDTFTFVPGEGMTKVERPAEGAGGRGHPLVGKPAPDADLSLLSGGTAKIGDHKGKEIVILDFWATWCGPCRMAMPVLADVAQKHADKGVVFYAVNQGEDADTIKAFLKEIGVSVTVALDPTAAIGDDYAVSGIPQTVIIGKDGIVRVVHVGFSPDLKRILPKQLDALIAGEDLAGE